MRIELVNTGTELLLGKVVNTHAAYVGAELFKLGLRVQRQTAVPDGEAIGEVLAEAFPRADVVLVTGGLGPTEDDLTRETVAAMLGRELRLDAGIREGIRERFRRRGLEASAANDRQAMVPEGAEVLPNPNGTAPGLHLPPDPGAGTPRLFLLPGPPRELAPMFEERVLPVLARLLPPGAEALRFRNFRICGPGESALAARLEAPLAALPGLEVGYCARPGEVDLRLIGAAEAVEAGSRLVREAFPVEIAAESEDSLEKVVVELLRERGESVATAESCTGGLLASFLTDVPGASAAVRGGFVVYANEAKTGLLGVAAELIEEHGAVSEAVARAMAEGCLGRSGADHAIAVTGIAGPDGGTPAKPVGTVHISLACRREATFSARYLHPGDRATFKVRTVRAALDLLRRRLRGFPLDSGANRV